MKKIYFFLVMLLVAGFSACTEDIGLDVAPPQSYPQEAPQVIEGFTIAVGDGFNSALVLTGEEQEFQVVKATATPELPEGATVVFRTEISDAENFEQVVELPVKSDNNAATVRSSDLSEAVITLFNTKAPVAHSIYLRTYFYILDGASASMIPTPALFGPYSITPYSNVKIESAYYLIGNVNGWGFANLADYKFSHSDLSVYDDPVFTITALMPENNYFKIVPQSIKDSYDNEGNERWDDLLGNPIDGNTDMEGTLIVGGDAMLTKEAQLVKITINMMESTYQIQLLGNIESAYYLIGDVNGWSFDNLADHQFSHSGQLGDPVFYITAQMPAGNFKIAPQSAKDASDWGRVLGNPKDQNTSLEGVLGVEGDGYGGAMRIEEAQWVKITINMREYTYKIELWGDIPASLYMIGSEFGGWDWSSDGVVAMTPVHGHDGHFWAVRYISAGEGFKWCTQRAWSGDFYSLGENIGYTTSDGNAFVAESGLYMIYADMVGGKISVEPAKVYGMGDCFGGWNTATYPFAVEARTMTCSTTGSGELRMYATSGISPVGNDWWRMEFVILDGKIAYRGGGDDQERVNVSAGKKVTLDFNAGIGTIE